MGGALPSVGAGVVSFFFLWTVPVRLLSTQCGLAENAAMSSDQSQHRVFWVSYAPALGESIRDLVGLIGRFTTGESAFFGRIQRDDGWERYEFVLCLKTPMRAAAVWSEAKWTRAGAKGCVLDVQYPREKQAVKAFIVERAAMVQRGGPECRFGSLSEVDGLRVRVRALLKMRQQQSRAKRCRARVKRVPPASLAVSCSPRPSRSRVSVPTSWAVEVCFDPPVSVPVWDPVPAWDGSDTEVQLALSPCAGIVICFCCFPGGC